MTDKTLTALTAAASFAATDLLYGKVGSDSRKITGTVFTGYLATATLAAGTITTSQPMTLTETWNDGAVTFTAFKVNVTATASAAASLLMDLQVASTSKFVVDKTGNVDAQGYLGAQTQIILNNSSAFRANSTGIKLSSAAALQFAQTADSNDTADVILKRGAANTLDLINGNANQTMRLFSANASYLKIESLNETHTLAAAATSDTTIQFPANSIPLGVTVRVTTLITGCTTFDVGISGATTKYGTGLALTAGTTNASAGLTSPAIPSAATSVRFSAVGGGASFSAGVIRVTLHYISLSAPTS